MDLKHPPMKNIFLEICFLFYENRDIKLKKKKKKVPAASGSCIDVCKLNFWMFGRK